MSEVELYKLTDCLSRIADAIEKLVAIHERAEKVADFDSILAERASAALRPWRFPAEPPISEYVRDETPHDAGLPPHLRFPPQAAEPTK